MSSAAGADAWDAEAPFVVRLGAATPHVWCSGRAEHSDKIEICIDGSIILLSQEWQDVQGHERYQNAFRHPLRSIAGHQRAGSE